MKILYFFNLPNFQERNSNLEVKIKKIVLYLNLESSQIVLKLDHVYRAEHFLHTKVLVDFIDTISSTEQQVWVMIKKSFYLDLATNPCTEEHEKYHSSSIEIHIYIFVRRYIEKWKRYNYSDSI